MDCRKCRFCRDMSKYGGRGSLRQKCIRRQCLRYSRILHTEDPIYTKSPVLQEELAAELAAIGGDPPTHTEVDARAPNIDIEKWTAEEEKYLPPPTKKKMGVAKGKTPGKGAAKGKAGQRGRPGKRKTKTRLSTSDFDFEEVVSCSITLQGH